eukprot:6174497-Pleurochrysis_carterae.AAC.2
MAYLCNIQHPFETATSSMPLKRPFPDDPKTRTDPSCLALRRSCTDSTDVRQGRCTHACGNTKQTKNHLSRHDSAQLLDPTVNLWMCTFQSELQYFVYLNFVICTISLAVFVRRADWTARRTVQVCGWTRPRARAAARWQKHILASKAHVGITYKW